MQNLLFVFISVIAIVIVLLLANLREGKRHRQFANPIMALLFVLIGLFWYFKIIEWMYLLEKYPSYKLGELNANVYNFYAQISERFTQYAEILYSLIIIGVFAVCKLVYNEIGRLLFTRKPKEGEKLRISRFSMAYMVDKNKQIVLRKEWVFTSYFLQYLLYIGSFIFLLLLILAIVQVQFKQFTEIYVPSLIAFALLIIAEVYWYLQHPLIEEAEVEEEEEEPTPDTLTSDYYNLWEEYQKVWPNKMMLAWRYQSNQHQAHSPTTIQIVEAQNLINAGYELSMNDYHIIDRLTKRNDMLIDDVITDNVAPLLFTVFLRRLMDGENILMLTPKRVYHNSSYHKQIVDWINAWFYKLTSNREFWKVQVFSRLEDVEMSSRIIVSSADDILEKGVVNHRWFNNLKTVLFLSADEMFAESLSANKTLLSLLRNKYDKMQSIVLSDYKEAMQSSVMRNLDVRSDLKEVRMERIPPNEAFVIFWRLEGQKLFQHDVLSGHIEKYLGAEAVLALLPRRERMKNISMVGQKRLPYYEYIEELDNNTQSLIKHKVDPNKLRHKGVNEITCDEVTFLWKEQENSILLARDSDYNAPVTLLKWESHATNNALVHVVCEPYLLRDYFIDNAKYFTKTPIYALSAKIMISRFEVARTLLELMVNQELSERNILEVLNGVNPNAVFVKQELHKLFRLAFGIDIIASNYLNIRTDYQFNKGNDTFEETTLYKLSPKIKDNISLSFLKNVEIIDQARNVLKIVPLDLVFQNYLPNQIHAFNGKPYNVSGFDRFSNRLRTNHRSPDPTIAYRPSLMVTLHRMEDALTERHKKNLGQKIEIELHEGAFDVLTKGYFRFNTAFSLQSKHYSFTNTSTSEVPVRSYQLGRMAILNINADGNTDIGRVTATLTVLMNEVLFTLFPNTHQYINIGSPVNNRMFTGEFANLYPTVKIPILEQSDSNTEDKAILLIVFEDSHQDLGLIQSIFDKWDYILRIIDDYLTWLLENDTLAGTNREGEIFRKHDVLKDSFLKYGFDEYPDFIDLEGTAKLLHQLLGHNYLTAERNDFYN